MYNRHNHVIDNRDLENAFRQIVSAGWAEKSTGDVNGVPGHVAAVPITRREWRELVEAVFHDHEDVVGVDVVPMPGYYIVLENQDGLVWVFQYDHRWEMDAAFAAADDEYTSWLSS